MEKKYRVKARAKGLKNARIRSEFTPLIVHRGFFKGHSCIDRAVPLKSAPCLKLRKVRAVCESEKEEVSGTVKVVGYSYDVPVINYQPKGGLCWNITGLSPSIIGNEKYAAKMLLRTTPLSIRVKEVKNTLTVFTAFNPLPWETFNFNEMKFPINKAKRHSDDPLYNKTECETLNAMKAYDCVLRINSIDEVGQKSFEHVVNKLKSLEPNKIHFIGMYRPKLKRYWPPTLELGRLCVSLRDVKVKLKRKGAGVRKSNASSFSAAVVRTRTRPSLLERSKTILDAHENADIGKSVKKGNGAEKLGVGDATVSTSKVASSVEANASNTLQKARKSLRTHFTRTKRYRDQLRAQIMALKYLLGNENPPPKLLADALQQGADGDEFGAGDRRSRAKRWNISRRQRNRTKGKRRYRSGNSTAKGDEAWNAKTNRPGRPRKRAKKSGEVPITLEEFGGNREDFELAKKIRKQKKERQAYELSKRRLEKIIACRMRDLPSSEGGGQTIEFLVKFKRESYLTGCLWVEPSMIANEGDTDGCEEMDEWLRDDETIVEDWEVAKLKPRTSYFKPEWTEIDRILACRSENEGSNEGTVWGASKGSVYVKRT